MKRGLYQPTSEQKNVNAGTYVLLMGMTLTITVAILLSCVTDIYFSYLFYAILLLAVSVTLISAYALDDIIHRFKKKNEELIRKSVEEIERLNNIEQRLEEAIYADNGDRSFDEISSQTDLPKADAISALRRLVDRNKFKGAIRWHDEIVSRSNTIRRGKFTCPNCSAKLHVHSEQKATCEFCDTEFYL